MVGVSDISIRCCIFFLSNPTLALQFNDVCSSGLNVERCFCKKIFHLTHFLYHQVLSIHANATVNIQFFEFWMSINIATFQLFFGPLPISIFVRKIWAEEKKKLELYVQQVSQLKIQNVARNEFTAKKCHWLIYLLNQIQEHMNILMHYNIRFIRI